jgi:hypothetical protein
MTDHIPSSNDTQPESEHKVGYKSPPEHTQFKKGKSGNPAGRRKHDGNLVRYLDKLMDEHQLTSTNIRMSKREAYVRTLIESARQGNSRSFRIFLQLARKAKLFETPPERAPKTGVITYKYDTAMVLADIEKVRAERKDVLARAARGELKEIKND